MLDIGNDDTLVARDHGRGRVGRKNSALTTSGRSSVPVGFTERIIIVKQEVEHSCILRAKCALTHQQVFDALLCFGVFTVGIKKSKRLSKFMILSASHALYTSCFTS